MRWLTSIVMALSCSLCATAGLAQQAKNTTPSTEGVDWEALQPGIEAALGKSYADCPEDRRWVEVLSTAEMGTGVSVAVVAFCHMGAYTSDTTAIWLKNGKPVVAEFRDTGKIVDPAMLTGASVRHGTDVRLFSKQHAVLYLCWATDEQGKLDSCGGTAYVWNPPTQTFDARKVVSEELSATECTTVRRQIDDLASH